VSNRIGIPATTPARTIFDLLRAPRRWRLPEWQLRSAIRQAAFLGHDLPGTGWDRSRSELETRFLKLCRRQRLPVPEVNAQMGPFVVDFLWREQWLVVETDGFQFHRGQVAFEDDRKRDLELRARGFEVLRLTYRQVTEDSVRTATVLRERLGQP
jgi:very-short-patch-repair endonuclease